MDTSAVPTTATPQEAPTPLSDLSSVLNPLRENWGLMLLAAILGAAISLYRVHKLPKIYTATAVLEVAPPGRIVKFDASAAPQPNSDQEIQTTIELLKGKQLLARTVSELDLLSDPDFISQSRYQDGADLASQLQVRQRRGTRLLDVSFSNPNPGLSAKLANGLVRCFLQVQTESLSHDLNSTLDALRAEANRLKQRLQKSEEALQNYQETHQAISLEEKQDTVTSALKSQASNLSAARSNRIRLETDLGEIQRIGTHPEALISVASIAQHPSVLAQQTITNEAASQLAALKTRYTEKHPKVISAKANLEETRTTLWKTIAQIPETLKSEFERAIATEKSFENALKSQEQQSLALGRQSIAYSVLVREMETDRSLYQAVLRRLKETDVETGLPSRTIRLQEGATPPLSPRPQNHVPIIALGLLAGLASGSSLILGKRAITSTIQSASEASNAAKLSVLLEVPIQDRGGAPSSSSHTLSGPDNLKDNPQKGLQNFRSSRQLRAALADKHRVLFTSPSTGDGKSFCSRGYASFLAAQGLRTLLIQADLRARFPNATKSASLTGLAELLKSTKTPEECIHATTVKNLFVMPPGGVSEETRPLAAQLLALPAFAQALRVLDNQFDCIVLDSPPSLESNDAAVLAALCDAVLIVARHSQTRKKDLQLCAEMLLEGAAPVVGIVLNGTPKRARDDRSWFPTTLSPALPLPVQAEPK